MTGPEGPNVASRPFRGIAFMVAGVTLFSVGDAMAKSLVATFSVVQILFFRSLVAVLLIVLVAFCRGAVGALKTTRPVAHALRAGAGILAVACFFFGLKYLPLADATALVFAAPLFMTLLSIPLLGEKVGAHRFAAVAVGFAGVLIVTRPGAGSAAAAALLPLAAAAAYALAMIATRRLAPTETSTSLIFSMALGMVAVTTPMVPFVWTDPGLADVALMASLGVVSTVAHLALVEAFRNAPVAVVAPFDYVAMVWAVLFGYLFWDELPDLAVWGGIAVIMGSGLYVLVREIGASSRTPRPGMRP